MPLAVTTGYASDAATCHCYAEYVIVTAAIYDASLAPRPKGYAPRRYYAGAAVCRRLTAGSVATMAAAVGTATYVHSGYRCRHVRLRRRMPRRRLRLAASLPRCRQRHG